jgi:hypothetical protein
MVSSGNRIEGGHLFRARKEGNSNSHSSADQDCNQNQDLEYFYPHTFLKVCDHGRDARHREWPRRPAGTENIIEREAHCCNKRRFAYIEQYSINK